MQACDVTLTCCCLDALPTAELKEKDESDLMILDLLPTEHSVTRTIATYLVTMQNNLVQNMNPAENK